MIGSGRGQALITKSCLNILRSVEICIRQSIFRVGVGAVSFCPHTTYFLRQICYFITFYLASRQNVRREFGVRKLNLNTVDAYLDELE